jgi:hypothetical protein
MTNNSVEEIESVLEVQLTFALPDKPDNVSREKYELTVVSSVLDTLIDGTVLRFIDDHGFSTKLVAAALLNTLATSLAHNSILLEIPKEEVIRGLTMTYDHITIDSSSDYEAGNA